MDERMTPHPFQTDDPRLVPIAEKVAASERLSFDEGLALYRSGDVLAVGWLANSVRERMHGDVTYFNVNRHINPTNVCAVSYTHLDVYKRQGLSRLDRAAQKPVAVALLR